MTKHSPSKTNSSKPLAASDQKITGDQETDKITYNYKESGVDIEQGNQLIDRIKPATRRTRRPEVLAGLGGFGGLCEIPAGYHQPVLVSGADGVGTKLKLALDYNQLNGIGIDLVAMCVNDIVVCGAEPLFFLDYYATGKLELDRAQTVIESIAQGCLDSGCSLIGGETAEMPGLYQNDDFDLAGFCVGVVEKQAIIDGKSIEASDAIVAIGSSGLHSNGFSLVRHIAKQNNLDLSADLEGRPIIDHLLTPTVLYPKACLTLAKALPIKGFAHITGGGLSENIPRILPPGVNAHINIDSWTLPAVFQWLKPYISGGIKELYRTLNCGVGMIAIMPAKHCQESIDLLKASGMSAWKLGEVKAMSRPSQEQPVVYSSADQF